jgi:hypothetical protein
MATFNFWQWLVQAGIIQGDPAYYTDGRASQVEYEHAIRTAVNTAMNHPDEAIRYQLWKQLVDMGAISGDHNYYAAGQASQAEIDNAIRAASQTIAATPAIGQMQFTFTATTVDPAGAAPTGGGGGTVVEPRPGADPTRGTVQAGNTVIPRGGRVVGVDSPAGSDAARLYYVVYEYEGVEYAFEVGAEARMGELFGTGWATSGVFSGVTFTGQGGFDGAGYVNAGMVDEVVGADQSFQAMIEVSLRAAGLEDLPAWIKDDPRAMQLVAEATVDDWSSGRLWVALSDTDGFKTRFSAMDRYLQAGMTVEQAVNEYVSDEQAIRSVVRRYLPPGTEVTTDYLGQVLARGWTPNQANMVLGAVETLKRRPEALAQANMILLASGLEPIDETGLLNVITGGAPDAVVEAFNTAAAGQALVAAGVGDLDTNLLLAVVNDTSTLRTAEDYKRLAQDLAVGLIRNQRELNVEQMGLTRDDLIAAAFGESNPGGKTLGETINLMARLERERQVAAQGDPGITGFVDDRDRLRFQGLKGL